MTPQQEDALRWIAAALSDQARTMPTSVGEAFMVYAQSKVSVLEDGLANPVQQPRKRVPKPPAP